MKARITALTIAVTLALPAAAAHAQCTDWSRMRLVFDDPRGELLRAAEVLGAVPDAPMFVRREQDEHLVCNDSLALLNAWSPSRDSTMFEVLAPSARMVIHSAYPRERNNGGLVETRGLSTALDFGIAAHWRFLSAVFAPRLTYQQNDAFTVPETPFTGRSQWANPYHRNIDLPKRFGVDNWSEFQLGASRIQAQYGPVMAGFSSANMWLGAARLFPLLMSNTAPGFPHAYITTRPISAWILDVEVNAIWGEVTESEYFDENATNDSHVITALQLAIAPHFIPGLQFGVARVYHDPESFGDLSTGEVLDLIYASPFFTSGGNLGGNAIGFVFGRFVLPESGFEVFGEWSREDTPYALSDLLREPDWTQAYALGFQKLIRHDRSMSSFYGELIHLGLSKPTFLGHGDFSMYTHSKVQQGHTNRGQMLGAAIGPGSDAQILGFQHWRDNSRSEVFFERTRYDDDTYYRLWGRRYGEARHQVEITMGASHMQRFGSFELEGGLNFSRRYDRDFLVLAAIEPPIEIENNWNPWLRFSWRPDLLPALLP